MQGGKNMDSENTIFFKVEKEKKSEFETNFASSI